MLAGLVVVPGEGNGDYRIGLQVRVVGAATEGRRLVRNLWNQYAVADRSGNNRQLVCDGQVRILLTNDDGIHAPGLRAIERELVDWGDISHLPDKQAMDEL